MKAKELIEILNKMDPETELSLYCGGEDYYEDHPIGGIEYASDDGEIVLTQGTQGNMELQKKLIWKILLTLLIAQALIGWL